MADSPSLRAGCRLVAAAGAAVVVLVGCGSTGSTGAPAPSPGPAGTAAVAAPAAAPAAGAGRPELVDGPVLARAEPVSVQIPVLGVRSDGIVPLGLQADGTMEVPGDGATTGWYTGAPVPGSLGPAVLAAHVDWAGEPGVFHDLHELQPGDDVLVGRADGSTAAFRVTRVEQYAKQRFPTEEVYGGIDHAGLRLITCGGSFDEEQDSYRDNVVVFARLLPAAG